MRVSYDIDHTTERGVKDSVPQYFSNMLDYLKEGVKKLEQYVNSYDKNSPEIMIKKIASTYGLKMS